MELDYIHRKEELRNKMRTNIFNMMGSHTLWLSVASVLCGVGAAGVNHQFDWVTFSLVLIFALLAQMTGNSLHYYIEVKSQSGHIKPNLVIQDMTPSEIYQKTYQSFALMALLVGLTLMAIEGWWVAIFGACLIALMYVMYGSKRPLINTPYSIFITFLLFGPVGVLGCCFIMMPDATNAMDELVYLRPALWMSAICGLKACSSYMLYNYKGYENDNNINRTTLVTAIGKKALRILFLINGLIVTACIVGLAYDLPNLPNYTIWWWTLVGTGALFLSLHLQIFQRMPYSDNCIWGNLSRTVDIATFVISAIMMAVLLCIGFLH